MKKAVVLLSGGQDSTTCLYWAKERFHIIDCLIFDYNQRHHREVEQAFRIASKVGVTSIITQLVPGLWGTSPLTSKNCDVPQYENVEELAKEGETEPTFVPARNILFLTLAANYAVSKGIKNIVTGVCQVDYGGYPDCRSEFIASMEKTLNIGIFGDHFKYSQIREQIKIHTPLMYLSKKETVLLAKELNCIEALADTHTCYEGKNPPCGKCHSCLLRQKGFEEAGIEDPLLKGEK